MVMLLIILAYFDVFLHNLTPSALKEANGSLPGEFLQVFLTWRLSTCSDADETEKCPECQ
jgi:hypothetical protein